MKKRDGKYFYLLKLNIYVPGNLQSENNYANVHRIMYTDFD